MNAPHPGAEESPGSISEKPTIKLQWWYTPISAGVLSILIVGLSLFNPTTRDWALFSMCDYMVGLGLALIHALWITYDLKRRGLKVGLWRYGAIFGGPLTICIYLTRFYGLRTLYLFPLYVLVLFGVFLPGAIVHMALWGHS